MAADPCGCRRSTQTIPAGPDSDLVSKNHLTYPTNPIRPLDSSRIPPHDATSPSLQLALTRLSSSGDGRGPHRVRNAQNRPRLPENAPHGWRQTQVVSTNLRKYHLFRPKRFTSEVTSQVEEHVWEHATRFEGTLNTVVFSGFFGVPFPWSPP